MSFFKKTFGEEAGGLIELFAFVLVPIIFMIAFILLMKVLLFATTNGNETANIDKSLNGLPQNSKQIIIEITEVNKKTTLLLNKLQKDINSTEEVINNKKQDIAQLEKKIKILKLTPEQTEIIENYNKSISNSNITILEWLKQKTVWYDISCSIIIAIVFFIIGRQSPRKKQESKIIS